MDWITDLPEWLRALFAQVKLSDIKDAVSQVSFDNIKHLINLAKDQELNAETIKRLFEEASELPAIRNNPIAAVALVICVIICVFPALVSTPVLLALGFTSIGPAAASIAASFQSMFGVNAVFSVLQSAAMSGYGAPIIAYVVQSASALGGFIAGLKVWALGNGTMI